jgi:hypothetical protein
MTIQNIWKNGEPLSEKALYTVSGYYDGLGFLLHKQLIDINTIGYLLSGTSTGVWEKVKPIIEGMSACAPLVLSLTLL